MRIINYFFGKPSTSFSNLLRTLLILFCATGFGEESQTNSGQKVSFYSQIKPIFQRECIGCHQPAKKKGDYVMTDFASLLQGGESDENAIIPGNAPKSLLLEVISPIDGEAEMPPDGDALSQFEIELIAKWINEGAKDDSPANSKISFSTENPPIYNGQPAITSLKFSPDGQQIAVAGYHEILLISAKTGEIQKRLIGESPRIQSIAWSPDGSKIAMAGGSPGRAGEIQVWDISKSKLLLSHFSTYDTLMGVSWSPDGTKVAFGGTDNVVRAISVPKGEEILYQGSHDDWPLDTTFSTDGDYVISVGRDMTAKLTHLDTQRFIDNITSITPGALKGGINSVMAHPKGEFIIFGGADGTPKIYRYQRKTKREIGDDANQILVLPNQPGRIFGVDSNAEGTIVASVSSYKGDGFLSVSKVTSNLTPPEDIRKILVTPTHRRNGDQKNKLAAYFKNNASVIYKKEFPGTPLFSVSLDPNENKVAASGKGGIVTIVDLDTSKIVQEHEIIPEISEVAQVKNKEEYSASKNWILPNERPEELPFQTLPKDKKIASLEVNPSQINISESSGYSQLTITGFTPEGEMWDLSRMVKYEFENKSIDVSLTGFVSPVANGESSIEISIGDIRKVIPVSVSGIESQFRPDWSLHVNPVLSRLGCNSGTCHGAKDGKNGFKLSLRGYDPVMDIMSLTDDIASRRVNFAAPTQSLMLLKSSSEIPHEGGQLVNPAHDYYKILENWILDGGDVSPTPDKKVSELRIYPTNPVIQKEGFFQQMQVIAVYPDGKQRDVTRESFVESGNTEVAQAAKGWPGLVRASRRGEAPLLVRYEGAYASTILTVMGDRSEFVWNDPEYNSSIDKLVAEKWKRMKIHPSGLSDDYTFVRRLYLDLTGLPPTSDQVDTFIQSPLPNEQKRNNLIDQLLHSEAYVDHWANKWADLLQVNSKFLGKEGTQIFRKWIRNEVAQNTPYDKFVSKIITANGSNKANPPASYYKILRDPEITMENTTHLFLATRFNCNKCHDHPFERWTQDQYYEMAAFFARTSLKTDPESKDKKIGGTAVESAKPLFEMVFEKDTGEIKHQRTGLETPPSFPFKAGEVQWEGQNRREVLADWITSSDNPYFASSYVNRLWGYLLGTGIIEPLDDIRAGNPPSNPQLLNYLTDEFIKSNFNSRHIIRLICQSRTYQLSVETNKWNEDDQINFSHAKARRLPAEVLYDSIHEVLGSIPKIPGVAPGTRASALPDSAIKLKDGFLGNFGRPARESSCECERSSDLQLGPVMALISGPTLGNAISDKDNILNKLIENSQSDEEWIKDIFSRILNRPASSAEVQATIDTLKVQPMEHKRLVAQLEKYTKQSKPHRDRLEKERQESIDSAREALSNFRDQWNIKKEKLTVERKQMVADTSSKLNLLKKDIRKNLSNLTSKLREKTQWTNAEIPYFAATNGSKLRLVENGNIMASGDPNLTTYDLYLQPDSKQITGLRLNTLPDKSLPKNGPGRASGDGNFVLTEIVAELLEPVSQPKGNGAGSELKVWDTTSGEASGWKPNDRSEWLKLDSGLFALKSEDADPYITVDFSGPSGWYQVDVLMEVATKDQVEAQLFYSEEKPHQYSEQKSLRALIDPKAGGIQNVSFLFKAQSPLKSLRLDPSAKKGVSTLYQISATPFGQLKSTKLKFSKAVSNFNQNGFEVKKAINGNLNGNDGWAIAPQMGKPHTALFTLEKPLNLDPNIGSFLKLSLIQNYKSKSHSIGRFNIQMTDSERADEFGVPASIASVVKIPQSQRSEDQTSQLVEYFADQNEEYIKTKKELVELKKPIPDDPKIAELEGAVKLAEMPVPRDPILERLKLDVELSTHQLTNPKLTVAQDLAWALINSPAFLFNH